MTFLERVEELREMGLEFNQAYLIAALTELTDVLRNIRSILRREEHIDK